MSTVGLSFGSATSGTGFDVTNTVNSIIAIQSGEETPWKAQLTSLEAQNTALSTIGTDLSTLTTSVQALTDATGALAEKQGSSSDTTSLTLTSASATSVAGSHTIVIQSLASTAAAASDDVTDSTAILSGSITIGTGTGSTITIGSSNDTLTTLAAAINSASLGVEASVVTDTNGSRLSINSSTSGAAGQAIISGITSSLTYTTSTDTTPTTLNINTAVSVGSNAELTVDGLSFSSASNTVTGAIPGVTFQLLAVPVDSEQIQVEITNDNSAVETAVQTFVTAYNAVVSDLSAQEKNNSSGTAEPLFGSPVISQLQSTLEESLTSFSAVGSVKNLAQLGLSIEDDGALSFDSSTLDSLLNTDYSDVQGFLQNTGSFGASLSTTLNNLGTQAPNGAIYLAEQEITSQETTLNTDITNENALIATSKANLTTELNTANQELQAIPEQLNEVNELYSAITGFNTGTSS